MGYDSFTFTTPTRIFVGWGAATDGRLAAEALRHGRRPLLVAGRSLQAGGMLDRILQTLAAVGIEPKVYGGVPPEPNLEAVEAGRAASAGCDSVIAIGGGSVLDVAKAVAGLSGAPGHVREYFDGERKVPESGGLPILAAPTTAGTGSEVTWVGVFTDKRQGKKASIRGGAMMPTAALLDPQLTVSCPASVTAHSGMDAFVQAVEAFTSGGANPLTDALALPAASLASCARILAAVESPEDRPVRESLALGSLMAGMALNTSRLGLAHGLAHPVGARTGAAHGLICAILLPHVVRFNRGEAGEKYRLLAQALAATGGAGGAEDGSVDALIQMVERANRKLGIPDTLGALGITANDIPSIVAEAMVSGSTKANPRPVVGAELAEFVSELL